ncbi:hypothetical protein V6Z11_D05G082900 [Gossypium hirsutum]
MGFPGQFVQWISACSITPRFSISVNGGIVGFFRGARGIKQGTVDSVIGIWCILQEFYYFSSLQLNVSKTEIFVAGMAKDDLVTVQRVTGFKLGRLLVR